MRKLLSVVNLKEYFPLKKRSVFSKERPYLRANEDISLDIYEGETFSLVGESGCGKSTLGRTILQLYKPTAGQVFYYGNNDVGVDLAKLTKKQMRPLRKELQIVFQDPYSSLNPRMTVGELIAEGPLTHRFFKKNSPQMQEHVLKVMEACGLQEYMLSRYPHQFSGGQRQRICIARALAVKPKFIVCDECVSALDVSIQSQILNLLADLKEKEGLTYLFISHNLSVVRHVSDRIAVMYAGRIMEMGSVEQIFKDTRHPYTISLLSALPTIEGEKKKRILLHGAPPSVTKKVQGCPFFSRCFMAKEECQRIPAPLEQVEQGHFVACHFSNIDREEKEKIARV